MAFSTPLISTLLAFGLLTGAAVVHGAPVSGGASGTAGASTGSVVGGRGASEVDHTEAARQGTVPSRSGASAPVEPVSGPPGEATEGDDCWSLAWTCETSDEVSKASARCSCGDADGACAAEACRRAEQRPSAAVRREQALSRRRLETCLRAAGPSRARSGKAGATSSPRTR